MIELYGSIAEKHAQINISFHLGIVLRFKLFAKKSKQYG